MTEAQVVANGEPRGRPLSDSVFSSTDVTDVDDIPRTNEMARSNAWNKPQISIESVDRDDIVIEPVSSPMTPPEVTLKSLEDSGSTDKEPSMCVKRTRVYPKTPPPSYRHDARSSCEVDGREESYEAETNPERNGKRESSDSNSLKICPTTTRSLSLPTGITMDVKRFSSNSDETVDSEMGSPTEKRKRMRHLAPHLYQDRLGSTGSNLSSPETSDDSSSDGAGEDDKSDIPLPPEQEDDIFIDPELSVMQEQADTKLISWACSDFVPACHQLLSRCCKSEKSALIKSANIQADLRSLSNTITFFCSEQQQRLSQVFPVKQGENRGVSQSTSTQTFPRPQKNVVELGDEETGMDRSYAVKVLRSASQSLIAPLLVQASQRKGFTPDLHQAIVKALQKIAWKVEACASFNNPSRSVEIHEKIFDAKHSENVRELMIQALPPAQPNLLTPQPPLPKLRKTSLPNISPEPPVIPMRRGQSVNRKLGEDVVVEADLPPPELTRIGAQDKDDDDDDVWKEGENEGIETEEGCRQEEESEPAAATSDLHVITEEGGVSGARSPSKKDKSRETTPNLPRRERIATEGEADLVVKSPHLKKSNLGGSIPNLDREEGDTLNDSNASVKSERYFRPKTFRRTTISLSRKEVQTLGLTVAKRVDESILDDIRVQREREGAHRRSCRQKSRGSKSDEKPPRHVEDKPAPGQRLELELRDQQRENYGIENPEDLDKVGDRLHNTLTKRFNHCRSASMSNIIDREDESAPYADSTTPDPSNSDRESDVFSPQPNQRLELVPQHKHLFRNASAHPSVTTESSQPASPSCVPARRSMQVTASSSSSCDWVMVETDKQKKSSMRGRAKATVKKSISSSGRLAHRLLKTGLSLRNSSSNAKPMSKSLSAADLLDESSVIHQQQCAASAGPSRLSMSIATSTPSYNTSTLPNRGKRKNTIVRLIRRGKDSRLRSFGKSDKYSTGNYPTWHPEDFDYGSGDKSFADSIETVSRNAIHSIAFDGEEQLLISVDMASKKLRKKQGIHNGSSLGRESSNPWFQISVNTNIKLFGRRDYIILRPFKEIQKLIDSLSTHGAIDLQMPRPDKKSGAKKQMKGMEDLLRSIAGNPHLRSNPAFVTFLRPDDQFGSFTENNHSEVSFERLMTFYTPNISSGPPGSFPSVQIVPAEHVPAEPTDVPRKSSLTAGHKKGSMHYMKRDGKDDTSTFVIQEEGEDALIVAREDDHYVVVAGTFEKLVEQLACEEKPDARFVTTFLLGYRHFATTLEFLTKLLERFHMKLPPNPTDEEMAYAEKWSYVIQLRVLDILTYWMKKCWPDVYRHPPVLEKLREFASFLKSTEDHNFQYAGTNIEKIIREKMANSGHYCLPSDLTPASCPSPTLTASHPPTSPSHHHHLTSSRGSGGGSPSRQTLIKRSSAGGSPCSISVSPIHRIRGGEGGSSSDSYSSVDVSSLPAIQLARQLTLIELEFLRAIDVHELVVFTWDPNTAENKPYRRNLDAFIERFNKVSYWVASEICCVEDVRLRGILLEKFIEVAKHCYQLKNYHTTISVLSGLSLAAVRRLKRSWELVNEKTRKVFTKLQPLTSPTTNHSNYRRALATAQCRDPCIPYLGVFMRDLTFFNDGNNKKLKNGLYNFSKLRTMVYKFEELKRYQRSKYFFPPEEKIREFCRNLWCLSEQELYDTSLRAEPREETDL